MLLRTRDLPAQLRLGLQRAPSYARAAFIVSASNAAATRALDAWPDWRGGALVLVGPSGSGKTHLATIWAQRVGARLLTSAGADAEALDVPLSIDDADRWRCEEDLFHLINRTARSDAGLLMTATAPPGRWPVALPDLRSRLNALPVAELQPPDDAVLRAMLVKFFGDRNLRPSEELLTYLLRRIERSGDAAREVVARLDEAADAGGRPLTRALAREVLEGLWPSPGA